MELMRRYPDKHFDLAVVDPPYGLGEKLTNGGGNHLKFKNHKEIQKWDIVPSEEYFKELFRVSRDQVIWGRYRDWETESNRVRAFYFSNRRAIISVKDGRIRRIRDRRVSIGRCAVENFQRLQDEEPTRGADYLGSSASDVPRDKPGSCEHGNLVRPLCVERNLRTGERPHQTAGAKEPRDDRTYICDFSGTQGL